MFSVLHLLLAVALLGVMTLGVRGWRRTHSALDLIPALLALAAAWSALVVGLGRFLVADPGTVPSVVAASDGIDPAALTGGDVLVALSAPRMILSSVVPVLLLIWLASVLKRTGATSNGGLLVSSLPGLLRVLALAAAVGKVLTAWPAASWRLARHADVVQALPIVERTAYAGATAAVVAVTVVAAVVVGWLLRSSTGGGLLGGALVAAAATIAVTVLPLLGVVTEFGLASGAVLAVLAIARRSRSTLRRGYGTSVGRVVSTGGDLALRETHVRTVPRSDRT